MSADEAWLSTPDPGRDWEHERRQTERERIERLSQQVSNWRHAAILFGFILGFMMLVARNGHKIIIAYDEPTVWLESWSWWGLSKKQTPIVWRATDDETGWMAKDKQGQWYIAIWEAEDWEPSD